MKQLLFLLLFPCLALAQYTGNAGQKISLGEQTSADGLVYRGLAADTTRKPSVDTMAYILLDTNTNIIWQYKKATNNAWTRVGGSISSGVTGTLPMENGGTNNTSYISGAIPFSNGTTLTSDTSKLFYDASNLRLGLGTSSPLATLELNKITGNLRFLVARGSNSVVNFGSGTAGTGIFGILQMFNTNQATPDIQLFAGGDSYFTDNFGIGTTSPTQKLHVVGNGLFTGNLGIGSATPTTSGSGITFPATQSASTNVNTLDDYEEGAWTPTIRGSTVSGTYTPSTTNAYYTKIGNKVTVWCFVDMRSGTATGGTGVLLLESLPFNYKAGSDFAGTTRFDFVDYPQASSHGTFAAVTTSGAAANIIFQISRDNASTESISITGFTTSSLLTTNFSYTTN